MENNIPNIKRRNLPKEVFLHLLAIITLYWSAASFITLLFQYINYFIPDVLEPRFFANPLRFAISSLVIVYPVFIFVSWLLYKSYAQDIEKREFRLRKWLIYFTLFATSLLIIGSLVSVINRYLQGDLTLKFVLKAFSIILVAGAVFGYYIDDVRRETPAKSARYFAWLVSAIVLIAVVGAFFIVGSPREERLRIIDQQKVNDLQNIQGAIMNYWQRKEKLPEKLADLNDPISGFNVPVDSQTGNNYEYNVKDAVSLTFELCAVFNRQTLPSLKRAGVFIPTEEAVYHPRYSQNWDHQAGRVCFERKIDKEFYPPLKKKID